MESSCLMLMMSLYAPIDLDFVISEEDLAEDGIEFDTHITAFYASDAFVPKDNILDDIKEFLGKSEYEDFQDFLKSPKMFSIYDSLGLDKFENPDYDVLIMRLKDNNRVHKILSKINEGFTKKYNLKSDFDSYNPHMTLAYLRPGLADKYLSSGVLGRVLDDSKVTYDDLMISYKTKDSDKYKEWYLTHYWCIPRHLRMEKLERNKKLLDK